MRKPQRKSAIVHTPRSSQVLVLAVFAYSVVSVFIGPLLVFGMGIFVFGEGGVLLSGSFIDCLDDARAAATIAEKEMAYRFARTKYSIIAGSMFLAGTVLLVLLVVMRRQTGISLSIRAGLPMIFMLFGYGMILALSNWMGTACD